jgi:ABC-type Na+ efflux pump permease subunit
MDTFNSQRIYCLIAGLILFSLGIFGFAFKTSFDIADRYLFAALILGFWGIVVSFNRK